VKVILDPQAGICGGVSRVVELAEKELQAGDRDVFVLGDIIHNEREVERLNREGLKTIHIDDLFSFKNIPPNRFPHILIRAHGEPPETFAKLEELDVEVIDGTCPVVLKSQKMAQQFYHDGYQIAVIGKHGHPEMIGIIGHTNHSAVVVQFNDDVRRLKRDKLTLVMVQTTISPDKFSEMSAKIADWVGEVVIKDTICRWLLKRREMLPEFVGKVDVVLVVGGHKSSNTQELHKACQLINRHSYHAVSPEEIDLGWFKGAETIGITGSASTPMWLLEEFVEYLERVE